MKRSYKRDVIKVGKSGLFDTFFALIKGYCAIVILILPKGFQNGGYIFSPIMLILSFFLTTRCNLYSNLILIRCSEIG